MPDITMCGNGQECDKKYTCRRHLDMPSNYQQSWQDFYFPNRTCDFYLEYKPKIKGGE